MTDALLLDTRFGERRGSAMPKSARNNAPFVFCMEESHAIHHTLRISRIASGGVGSDGANPNAALVADKETGALYGTAQSGGASGNGTVFKIDTIDQTLATIYSFSGSPDGATPGFGALLADDEGVLCGTTIAGGASGNGTVFKVMPPASGQTPWTETVLWSFSGGNDGRSPQSGELIADEKGALYGTTEFGGTLNTPACGTDGCGVVFKLTGTGFVPNDEE